MGGDLSTLTDAELVALSQQGNLQAFNNLADRWNGSLFRFTCRTLGNEDDARDVVQEALLRAYQNIGRLRDPAKFKSWVHHIALNLCRDKFRSAAWRASVTPYEEEGEAGFRLSAAEVDSWAGDRAARQVGLSRVLQRALETVPDEQRTAILLREYQGFTSEEIGEITGVPAATVRTRIFYGLKTVRKTLQSWGVSDAAIRRE